MDCHQLYIIQDQIIIVGRIIIHKFYRMYRKLSVNQKPEFSNYPSYNSQSFAPLQPFHLSTISNIPVDIFCHPYKKSKDDFPIINPQHELKRQQKGHTRVQSELVEKTNRQDVRISRNQQSIEETNSLEERLLKIENRMSRTEYYLSEIRLKQSDFDERQIIQMNKKQRETKTSELLNLYMQLKQKVQKICEAIVNLGEINIRGKIFETLEESIETSIQSFNKVFSQKIQKEMNLLKEKHELETCAMKKQLNEKIIQINQKIKSLPLNKPYDQFINKEAEFFRANRKYSGNPISFLYQQYIKKNCPTKDLLDDSLQNVDVCINQITYYIDPDGFLLDEKNHYIVNNDLKNIKLSEKEIRMLRKHKILSS